MPPTNAIRLPWLQVTKLKKAWLLVQFISVTLFMGLAFRTVVISDQTMKYISSAKAEGEISVDQSKSGDYAKRPSVEFWRDNENNAKEPIGNGNSYSPVCRKPLMHLWTQYPNSTNTTVFPACKVLLNAIENGTYAQRKWLYAGMTKWKVPFGHNQNTLLETLRSCEELRKNIDFQDKPASQEEADFPLAFVFVPFRNLAQTVRLFRMIYQPQNAYCINYDAKSGAAYREAIISMASCFPNVYLNPNPEPIYYAKYSVLHSTMECMKVLRNSPIKWRYMQVVSWNDFPLKTNWEMVKIFKSLNGSQDSELIENEQPTFTLFEAGKQPFKNNGVRIPVPPAGITLYKGSYANSLSREFVEFMFTDPLSLRFYDYFDNRSICPEEFYWTSLIHNLQLNAPGGFPGQCFTYYTYMRERKPFISRFQVWSFRVNIKAGRRCRGKYTNSSCVFGIRDLITLITRMELFAHKLYEEFEPAALYCLEEWYWDRVCMGQTDLNTTDYENMPSVQFHNLPASEKDTYICV